MKKKIFLIIISAICILSGCSQKGSNEAKAAVENFLQEFQGGEYENMYALTNDGARYYDGIYMPESEISCLLFDFLSDNMEYEITDCDMTGENSALIKADITNVKIDDLLDDVEEMYLEYCAANEDVIDDIDLNDLLYQITEYKFNSGEYGTQTKQTEFTLTNESGQWLVESGIIIYDDMSGGYITYFYKNTVFGGLDANDLK